MNAISTTLAAGLVAIASALPMSSYAAPDSNQQYITQKILQAKRELAAAQSASGVERQKMMEAHMNSMSDAMAHMQKAKPGSEMSPEQMREWIDEHLKLMNEMMGQMMQENHMMMQGSPGKK